MLIFLVSVRKKTTVVTEKLIGYLTNADVVSVNVDLKTIKHLTFIIDKNKLSILTAHCDWACDRLDQKLTTRNLFKLRNGVFSWSSKKQNCVVLSSAEAENIATYSATQEVQRC